MQENLATDNKWQKRILYWYAEPFIENILMGNDSILTFRKTATAAFHLWEKYIPLRFIETFTRGKSDIQIKFARGIHGDDKPFDGPGGTLAHAFLPRAGTWKGHIHLDADENWQFSVYRSKTLPRSETSLPKIRENSLNNETILSKYNLYDVLIHEIGHSLGLGHSTSADSVMYPYYVKPSNWFYSQLPSHDIWTIQQIYGKPTIQYNNHHPHTTKKVRNNLKIIIIHYLLNSSYIFSPNIPLTL